MAKDLQQKQTTIFFLLLFSLLLLFIIPVSSAADSYIELIRPPATHSTSERIISFQFAYHKEDNGLDSASCELILNGTSVGSVNVPNNQANSITVRGFVIGTYRWHVYCNSTLFSENRTLYIDPGEKPSVHLIAPLSGYKGDMAVPFKFAYNAGDDAPARSICEFWINDTMVRTFDAVSGDALVVEKSDLGPGSYRWYVVCGRNSAYEAKSLFYEFFIRKTSKPPVVNTTPVILPPVPQVPVPNAAETGNDGSPSPSSQSGVRMAVLSAPATAEIYENISLRLLFSDGTYVPGASIKVYGPSARSLVTDENGEASFSPDGIGNYTYSVPDFSLLRNPSTEVFPNTASAARVQFPSINLSAIVSSTPVIASFVILVLLLAALGLFFYFQRKHAQEEQLLHPEHLSPTGLVDVSADAPNQSAELPQAPQSSLGQSPPQPEPPSSPQLPQDKVIEANPLEPPAVVSIPADNKPVVDGQPEILPPLPPTPSMTSTNFAASAVSKSSTVLSNPSVPLSKPKGAALFAPLPPPGKKTSKKD